MDEEQPSTDEARADEQKKLELHVAQKINVKLHSFDGCYSDEIVCCAKLCCSLKQHIVSYRKECYIGVKIVVYPLPPRDPHSLPPFATITANT